MLIASFAVGPWQSNCYLLASSAGTPDQPVDAVVVDAGPGAAPLVERVLTEQSLRLAAVVASHGHLDHVLDAAGLCAEHDVALWIHPRDRHLLSDPLAGLGQGAAPLLHELTGGRATTEPARVQDLGPGTLELAGLRFEVLEAPGHTAGSVLLRLDHPHEAVAGVLLSGDVLFAGSVGRTDLPGGDAQLMATTLAEVVSTLAEGLAVLPGHGPQTTMAAERAGNPFLQQPGLVAGGRR